MDFRAIEAVDDFDEIKGMVGYDNSTPNSIEIHFAVEGPMAIRALVRPAFQYPFEQGSKNILIGRISADKARALDFVFRLGFHTAYRVRSGWAEGIDLVFVQMRKSECRWLDRKAA